MTRALAPVLTALLAACALAQEPPESMLSLSGLSGYPGVTTADVVPEGFLSVQGGFLYSRISEGVQSMTAPLAAAWGLMPDLELGASLDIYLDDDRDDALLGDLGLSGKWLYETARAGNELALLADLSLPTGVEGRDPGAELGMGFATSGTFRMFRLTAGFQYVLSGGHNPFGDDELTDYGRFEVGGTSFVRRDLMFFLSATGSTAGQLVAAGGASAILGDALKIGFVAEAALDGHPDFSIGCLVNWGTWLQ
ncbi:hypothetical protein JW921_10155 [Candidatus Fermentibacterales bacterium]|nr:hypothetical protein [Candidatus Fermentibacterales bacterium]